MRRLILSVMLLTGCSSKILIGKPNLDISPPPALELDDITFTVIHKDNANDVFAKMEKDNQTPVLIGLTGDDYKNLSINIKKIENYLREQRRTIILYREYYEGKNK